MPGSAVDDVCLLPDATTEAVFDHLCLRYEQGQPYTAVGSIVIAINPHEWLDIYRDELDYLSGKKMPAHVYRTSARAYAGLQNGAPDQCILISGVAGSGKTETAKLIRRHLAALAATAGGAAAAAAAGRKELLEASTLLLEAFSNAAAAGNDNSSRAGVITDLLFDGGEAPTLSGSRVRTYLLEESRVVARAPGEGNFHILHLLADACGSKRQSAAAGGSAESEGSPGGAGVGGALPPELMGLQLEGLQPDQLPYVGTPWLAANNRCTKAADALASVLRAFGTLGLSAQQRDEVLRALAGVLHLGRVTFVPDMEAGLSSGSGGCRVGPESVVRQRQQQHQVMY